MKTKSLPLLFKTCLVITFSINAQAMYQNLKEHISKIAQKTHTDFSPHFQRVDEANPVIKPNKDSSFHCPVKQELTQWEYTNTFNPAAVVKDNQVYLLYRADDDSQIAIKQVVLHTSRIGVAKSTDGLHFERKDTPVLFPKKDDQLVYEWAGGCEDPRIVEAEDGTYIMTYTQANHPAAPEDWKALLAIATSKDLINWTKHGYAFAQANSGKFGRRWSKSGSIVSKLVGDRLIATKIQNKYVMYWGEGTIYIATSDDLISWEPLLDESGEPCKIMEARAGKFDSRLVEPGPPAIITQAGISLFYNGKNATENGCAELKSGAYSAGQVLFDSNEPTKIIARSENCFFKPEKEYEKTGQYKNGTVFIQGLVYFQNKWFLYYGTADSAIGVACYEGTELHKIGL